MEEDFTGAPGLAVVAEIAQQSVKPTRLEPNTPYAFLNDDGSVSVQTTPHRDPDPLPDHIKAARSVADAPSFVDYVQRHYDLGTEVYADLASSTVRAILDGPLGTADDLPPNERPRWEDHRLDLILKKTPAWDAWAGKNGKWLAQADFAEHIEDNLADIVEPAAADMLEIAQSIQAARGVEFKSSQRLSTGETKFTYAESTDARAGKSGHLEIPERFRIGLIPFLGGTTPYGINVRFRYRLRDGDLHLAYKLDRPEAILEDAFKDVLDGITAGIADTGVPVFLGRP